MPIDIPWIVFGPEPHLAHCDHCGTTTPAPLPADTLALVARRLRRFFTIHQTCQQLEPCPAGNAPATRVGAP